MATELHEETNSLFKVWRQAKQFHRDMDRAASFARNESTETRNRLKKLDVEEEKARNLEQHAKKALEAIEETARAMGVNISRDWRA